MIGSNGCLDGNTRFYSNADDYIVFFYDPTEDYFMEEDESEAEMCHQRAICELESPPSVDQFCKDPTYVTPSGDPFSPGECKDDNDPKSNRICRACFQKTTISFQQLALINADTVQTKTYEENEDCFEGPPIL